MEKNGTQLDEISNFKIDKYKNRSWNNAYAKRIWIIDSTIRGSFGEKTNRVESGGRIAQRIGFKIWWNSGEKNCCKALNIFNINILCLDI
jgi:hypothetical protein